MAITTPDNDFYKDYMINKAIRKPFYEWTECTSTLLELIHTDIFGPASTTTNRENQYFISFIDNYTRKVYVYFLSMKDDALKKFKEFKAIAENQTNQKIKTLHSDNSSEYINR